MGWKGCLGFIEKINHNFYLSRKSTLCKFKFLLTKQLFKAVISMYNLFASLLGVHSQMVCASPFPEHGKRFLGFTNWGCAAVSGAGRLVGFPFTCCGLRLLPVLGTQSVFYYDAWNFTGKFRVAVHVTGSYNMFVYMFWWNPSWHVHSKRGWNWFYSTQTILSIILKQQYSQVRLLWKQLVFHVKNLRKMLSSKPSLNFCIIFFACIQKQGLELHSKQPGTSQTEAVLRE